MQNYCCQLHPYEILIISLRLSYKIATYNFDNENCKSDDQNVDVLAPGTDFLFMSIAKT